MRACLLARGLDERHPYRERFGARRALIEAVPGPARSEGGLDEELRRQNTSLRCVAREIPPVFGSFFSS